jgi:hypothetical protein
MRLLHPSGKTLSVSEDNILTACCKPESALNGGQAVTQALTSLALCYLQKSAGGYFSKVGISLILAIIRNSLGAQKGSLLQVLWFL